MSSLRRPRSALSRPCPQVHFRAILYHPNPMHRNKFACSCRLAVCPLILAAVLVSILLFAQTPQVPTFTAGKLDASAEGPAIDGRVNDADLAERAAVHDLHAAGSERGRAGHRKDRGPRHRRQGHRLHRHHRVRQRSVEDHRVAGAPRRVAERDRLGRDGVRHLQRQPERVRVRHQPARHRVRRPGRARRADERRVARRRRRPAARSAAASARSIRTGTATGRSARRSPSAAGKPRWRFR